ncbi:hypothetical protein Tco_1557165, partial [Tanacetum coccineum]
AIMGYPAVIEGYGDANWISDIKDSRSTSGYVFTLEGAAISWKSSKQTVIAKSTMELEFIAAHRIMYNGKSRHIHRQHNSTRQLISTGVISIDYVKSKDNIADPLTKGLSRELVSNGYPRKGQKSKPKRQNRAREPKEREAKVKIEAKSKSQDQVKVNPGKWQWKEHRKPNPKT